MTGYARMFDSKSFLATVTRSPGVYLMTNEHGEYLYIGKAKNLQKRLSSYFRVGKVTPKTQLMISQISNIEIRVTHTENEALLLENNLIKENKPRYNVVFRDDKSYPYIRVTTHHTFPGLNLYRGSLNVPGRFFGPYASVGSAREILAQLQKIIPVRQCKSSFFSNRSRPCLQYQIKRCSGPCVGLVEPNLYTEDVDQVLMLLEGRSNALAALFTQRMEDAANDFNYEKAADYRDRITALREVQSSQKWILSNDRAADIVTAIGEQGTVVVGVMSIRNGHSTGGRHYFFRPSLEQDVNEVITTFLPQFYLRNIIPKEIIVSPTPKLVDNLANLFSEKAGHKVLLKSKVRGQRAQALSTATHLAEDQLARHLSSKETYQHRLEELSSNLGLKRIARRIECFDISHTGGEAVVASCVVFGIEGAVTSDYRRFSIREVRAGDDYAAMTEVLTRRFRKIKKWGGMIPDLLIIDGGKGHLNIAKTIIDDLGLRGVGVAAIAKGEGRKPVRDRVLVVRNGHISTCETRRSALHLIQQIRDEAHRFAITGHRRQRMKKSMESPLEQIAGVGAKRRQLLLRYFGGIKGISRAGVEDLIRVPSINLGIARRIYQYFHT